MDPLIENKNFNPKLKNSLRATCQSKSTTEPEPKDLDFQIAEIVYSNKDIQEAGKITTFFNVTTVPMETDLLQNKLIWGDNLLVAQALLNRGYEGKFDLIYIDPPFNTGEDFNFPTNVTIEQTSYKKELSMIE
jgi:adenine-specific DNA-methyltransferase